MTRLEATIKPKPPTTPSGGRARVWVFYPSMHISAPYNSHVNQRGRMSKTQGEEEKEEKKKQTKS